MEIMMDERSRPHRHPNPNLRPDIHIRTGRTRSMPARELLVLEVEEEVGVGPFGRETFDEN